MTFDETVPYIIRGWQFGGQSHPGVNQVFVHNAISWFGSQCKVVRYEELCKGVETIASRGSVPEDWKDRVLTGADPKLSATFLQNLGLRVERRTHLRDSERLLFSAVVPTLRGVLGYEAGL